MSGESELQFVDTNVIVYAHDLSAGEKHERASQIIKELWESEGGCLSVQVLQEFYVTTTLKVARPMDPETAGRIIRELSHWHIHSPEAADVLGAIELHRRAGISFWDAMILWSARKLGCTSLLSEDLNPDQVYNGVRVLNPFIS